MPEDVISPGNYWFTNDLSNNDTVRNRRDVVFEDGEIAQQASWPWVVGITGSPKQDYCHVQIVSKNYLCGSRDITVRYAEFSDLNIEEIQEMNEKFFRRLRQDFLTHLLIKYFMKYARGLPLFSKWRRWHSKDDILVIKIYYDFWSKDEHSY